MTFASYLQEVQGLIAMVSEPEIRHLIDALVNVWRGNRRVYVFGNGGSASTASHFACDLAKGTAIPGRPPFRVVSLVDNVALLTAWANDSSFEDVFASQLRGVVESGDLVIGISTSGDSSNVLRAMAVARAAGATTVGFIGYDGGRLRDIVDLPVIVPGRSTPQCEDVHLILQHAICHCLCEDLARLSSPPTHEP